MYSLSEATERYLGQLQEPLLIRGYFSAKTHPLLAPLVPRIHDLLEEYAELGRGKVRIEIVDPHKNQALEEEAASKYGIRPIPFQIASRHQSGVVNSYFHIVVSYGDQTETLNFEELTEFKAGSSDDLEVALKNPEYSITSSIKKVLTSYRAGGNPFDSLTGKVIFRGYISPTESTSRWAVHAAPRPGIGTDRLTERIRRKIHHKHLRPRCKGGRPSPANQ